MCADAGNDGDCFKREEIVKGREIKVKSGAKKLSRVRRSKNEMFLLSRATLADEWERKK